MEAVKEEKEEEILPPTIPLSAEQWISLNALKSEDDFFQQKIEELGEQVKKLELARAEGQKLKLEVLGNVATANNLPPSSMNEYVQSGKELVKASK